MDEVVIRAENLGKKYVIGHQIQRERYVALRDVLARGAKNAFRKTIGFGSRTGTVDQVTEEFWALDDVSFEVKRGEVLGIIGRNGAGKSTLLKILSRITEPSKGRVTVKGRVASLLEVGTGFHPELTGRENVYLNGAILGMTRAEIKRKFDEIVAFAEVERFLDTPVKRYSSGMYVRLAFAVAAHLEPEILVVDEVLAVGDAEFQKKCLGKMDEVAGHGRTILFVSHNMQALSALCARGLVLSGGRILADAGMNEAIGAYAMQTAEHRSSAPHILFERGAPSKAAEAAVIRVEMLDENANPRVLVPTLGAVTFRIWVRAQGAMPQASVILSLRSLAGGTLAKFETNPRRIQPVKSAGDQFVDCCIEQLPLLPGQYFISVGLAHYGVDIIDWKMDIGTVIVAESGSQALEMSAFPDGPLVVRHHWESNPALQRVASGD
jgi:lipopolysaccharide transport system ATP-binding protein